MRKIAKIILLSLVIISALTGCEKEEDTEVNDTSLIIVNSRGGMYAIVSPTTGAVRSEIAPDVVHVTNLALGYQSQKAVITSKPPTGLGVKVIYTCDRETGDNLLKVTSEEDWDVLFIDVAQTGPKIVFSAQNVNLLSDDNIHKINEDGTGYMRLSYPDEGIDCPSRNVSLKLVAAYDPSWSPNGSKIAFDGHSREVVDNHSHNSIIIMDSDGGNKQIIWDVAVDETHCKDICWTQDGQFLIFLVAEGTGFNVKVLNVNSKEIIDITSHLVVNGLHTTDLWTSPNENKIVFNKYEPGGGDLYEIDFAITGDQFEIVGTYKELAVYQTGVGIAYGAPDWQLWDGY